MRTEAELMAELNTALEAMAASFHVRLIGTFAPNLLCASADEDSTTWLANSGQEFDQFPVRMGDTTIGLLYRDSQHAGRSVREAMDPLSEANVVSADLPIVDLIPDLRDCQAKLVLRGHSIDGLVTQSDLLKLPIRQLLFGLVSHLESCLRELVRRRYPSQQWLELLPSDRVERINRDFRRLKRSRFEPDILECTQFQDVVIVLERCNEFDNTFAQSMHSIRMLRNDVAHGKTFIHSSDSFRQFVDVYVSLRRWINQVTQLVAR